MVKGETVMPIPEGVISTSTGPSEPTPTEVEETVVEEVVEETIAEELAADEEQDQA